MQREIALLLLAMRQRHRRQAALLERLMSSIKKSRDANSDIIGGTSGGFAAHEATLEQDRTRRHELEGEIEKAIYSFRTDTAREGKAQLKELASCSS